MALKLFEVKQQRNKAIADARAIMERANVGGEIRALSAEDKEQVDKAMAEANSLDELIERLEAIESAEGEDAERSEDADTPVEETANRRKSRPMALEQRDNRSVVASKEYRKAFNHFLRTGYMAPEYRDVTMSPNSGGGYLVTPTQISQDIVMQINNLVFIRGLTKVETVTSAQSLGVRQITTQPSDAAWTSEVGSVSPDSTMAFGRRDLTPNLLAKDVAISIRLLEASDDVEPLVNERLAYKLSVAQENAFLNGDGSGKPLGVFTASNNGVPTSQDVVCTAASSTTLLADSLISAKYGLKQPYLAGKSVGWIFHRSIVAQVRLLKDSYGRYLWADGGGFASAPDTILGIPVYISEYAPSALTAGAYVGVLGNFSYYRIAEVRDIQIQRLVELYAGTNEIGFIARQWVDGAPVLGEAFARLQIHS